MTEARFNELTVLLSGQSPEDELLAHTRRLREVVLLYQRVIENARDNEELRTGEETELGAGLIEMAREVLG